MADNFWVNLAKKVVKTVLKSYGVRTSAPTFNQHVVPHKEKGWAIKGEGNKEYTAVFDTQQEAIDRARLIATTHRSSVIIHRKDGTIRDRMNYK